MEAYPCLTKYFPVELSQVPTSTNSLVELMNMVEQWREKVEYGPVCVVSP